MRIRYYILLGLYLLIMYFILTGMPRDVNWQQSFSRLHTIPYGCFVLFEELDALFPEAEIDVLDREAHLANQMGTSHNTSSIYINNTVELPVLDRNALLSRAEAGQMIFISAMKIDDVLLDTFGLETESVWPDIAEKVGTNVGRKLFEHELSLIAVTGKTWTEQSDYQLTYFSQPDSSRIRILGTVDSYANFVKVPFGKGCFFLHTSPFIFTNFNLLRSDNHAYVASCMSYLSGDTIIWDEYHKAGRPAYASSPLATLLLDKSFRIAIYLSLIGILLFIFFHAKRKQRIIPLIDQFPNTSLEFVHTIGDLYFDQGDHGDLARKKIAYLRDYLHDHLKMRNISFSGEEAGYVAQRSGHSEPFVASLFQLIRSIESNGGVTEETLFRLTERLQTFYHRNERKSNKRALQGTE